MSPLVKSISLVFVGGVIGSFAAVLLKVGAARLTKSVWSFLNLPLAFGAALYLLSTVFYLFGIKGGQLSVLYPMVSLGYIWTLLWSRIFFKEKFPPQKFIGLALILAGVVLVGMGAA
ncbi:MAG TPA: EamA family transporter [Verrucomicrobiae bacterium]|nr:EamA family transporter [Verrucomicrobiae bacterium]